MSEIKKNCGETETRTYSVHPNSLANLQPYQSGDQWSGNPNGRPKFPKNQAAVIGEILNAHEIRISWTIERELNGQKKIQKRNLKVNSESTVETAILAALSVKAMNGCEKSAAFLFDRRYGRPLNTNMNQNRELPSSDGTNTFASTYMQIGDKVIGFD